MRTKEELTAFIEGSIHAHDPLILSSKIKEEVEKYLLNRTEWFELLVWIQNLEYIETSKNRSVLEELLRKTYSEYITSKDVSLITTLLRYCIGDGKAWHVVQSLRDNTLKGVEWVRKQIIYICNTEEDNKNA